MSVGSLIFVVIAVLAVQTQGQQNDFDNVEYEKMLNEMLKKSLGEPNTAVGELVSGWTPDSKQNPEEMGTYYESDILMPLSDFAGSEVAAKTRKRWPTNVVPVAISGDYENVSDSRERQLLTEAMARFRQHTCISFTEYDGQQTDYLEITSENTGCWSALGRMGGRQRLNLQRGGCTSEIGTPIHELMHAIGIPHEQSRRDRDDHILIYFQNIKDGMEHNFETHRIFSGLGAPYDYGSVMHYGPYAFSKNRQPTIVPRNAPENTRLGQRTGFSRSDITKINNLYSCDNSARNNRGRTGPERPTAGRFRPQPAPRPTFVGYRTRPTENFGSRFGHIRPDFPSSRFLGGKQSVGREGPNSLHY